MKSIDVFCHLMPPEYAKICMAEAPNKSHMFVRALNVASMSNMDARNEVLKAFPGYKQIPQHRFPAGRNLCRAGQIPPSGCHRQRRDQKNR